MDYGSGDMPAIHDDRSGDDHRWKIVHGCCILPDAPKQPGMTSAGWT
jgi:hypothetical protein